MPSDLRLEVGTRAMRADTQSEMECCPPRPQNREQRRLSAQEELVLSCPRKSGILQNSIFRVFILTQKCHEVPHEFTKIHAQRRPGSQPASMLVKRRSMVGTWVPGPNVGTLSYGRPDE